MTTPVCCGSKMVKSGSAGSGNQRYLCRHCGTRTTNTTGPMNDGYSRLDSARYAQEIRKKIKSGLNTFFITCAQNNTKPDRRFFESVKMFCKKNKAALIIKPLHYKNISLFTASKEYKKKWHNDLLPYIIDEEISLGKNVVYRGDVNIAATAANPLSSKGLVNHDKWVIFGHAQVAMHPVATPGGMRPKRMYTTGAITVKNYSRTNDGIKANEHHSIAGLVIEVKGNKAWIRQVHADSRGCFYDLDSYYTPSNVTSGHSILALTPGDGHEKFMLPSVKRATYTNNDSIVNTLKPKYIVHHDIFDCYFGSHHHDQDDVLQFRKYHKRDNDARAELDSFVRFLNETTPKYSTALIVRSNHHEHFDKWLNKVDPKKDHHNALLVHEIKKSQYENALKGLTTHGLEIYASKRLTCSFKFLPDYKPFLIKNVDYSQHGHKGIKGARGNIRSFAKTMYKMVVGHGHGAWIFQGTTMVGTSTGRLEYEAGLGDNSNTHCIQYKSGFTTLIDIYNDNWRMVK